MLQFTKYYSVNPKKKSSDIAVNCSSLWLKLCRLEVRFQLFMDIQKKHPGAKSCGLFSQFTPGGALDSLPGQRSEKKRDWLQVSGQNGDD